MKSNVVQIKTAMSIGSGILFECECNHDHDHELLKNLSLKSYLILTNYHVLAKAKLEQGKNKGYIGLEIYDENDRLIPYEAYKEEIEVFFGNGIESYQDIVALLVYIDEKYKISIQNRISFEDITEEAKIHIEGFCGLLQQDISNRIIFKGNNCSIYPESPYIGRYIINENHHWYEDITDKQIFEGLSGAPVLYEEGKNKYLIGMNYQVSNIQHGQNPFKLIYYIKIEYIFQYLREQGCLIFQKENDIIKIRWIYEERKEEGIKLDTVKNMLVLGGSGAGKSSFIKSFALHNRDIDSSGDGQTTRMDIRYVFKIYSEKPYIEIKFQKESEFISKRKEQSELSIISALLKYYFKIEDINILEDPISSLRNFCFSLECVSNIMGNKDNKYFSLIENLKEKLNFMENLENIQVVEFYKKIFVYLYDLHTSENNNKKSLNICQIADIFDMRKRKNVYNKLPNKSNYEKQEKVIRYIIERNKTNDEDEKQENLPEILKEEIKNILEKCYGFFDIKEFSFLDKELELEDEIKTNCLEKNESDKCNIDNIIEEYWTRNKFEFDIKDIVEKYLDGDELDNIFKEMYKNIKEKVDTYIENLMDFNNNEEKFIEKKKEVNFKFYILELEDKAKQFITRCLKVDGIDSLTGIINKITIEDSICNEYAYMLYNLGLNEISFIDTCGLDHVESGRVPKQIIRNKLTKNEEEEREIGAVLYLKKLDSGRPTELKKILPMIYEADPKIPIYCIFTGIDIFCSSDDAGRIIVDWDFKNKDNYFLYPKSVKYLMEYGRQDIFSYVGKGNDKQNFLFNIFIRNLIPYCSIVMRKENRQKFLNSNKNSINKLITSLVLNEYSNNAIVDTNDIVNKIESKQFLDDLKESIRNMFLKASIGESWEFHHHKTIEANADRIIGINKYEHMLGYCGISERNPRNRWDMLFKDAYIDIFTDNEKLISHFSKAENVISSIIINLRDEFLKLGRNFYLLEKSSDKEVENNFRGFLERMYEEGTNSKEAVYKVNPFSVNVKLDNEELMNILKEKDIELMNISKEKNNEELMNILKEKNIELKDILEEINVKLMNILKEKYEGKSNNEVKKNFLKDITNFKKGIENKNEILEDLTEYYKKLLIEKVKNKNEEVAKNVIINKKEIYKNFEDLEKNIQELFGNEDEKDSTTQERIQNLLNQYFKLKNSKNSNKNSEVFSINKVE